jgi:hypothetical protein
VFISLSAFIIVRFLNFKKSAFVDNLVERRVRRSILVVVIITIIPSLVMAYNIVNHSIFERNANRFITDELNFENTQIVSKNISYKGGKSMIEVFLLGETIEPKLIEKVKSKLKNYGLVDTEFKIRQGINSERVDLNTLRTGVIEDLYRKNEEIIKNKDAKITLLESELSRLKSESFPVEDISKEIKALNSNLSEFTMNKSILTDLANQKTDTLAFAYARFKKKPSSTEINKLKEWLSARTKYENIRLVVQ